MAESRMVKSAEVDSLLAKARKGTTREQVEEWLLNRGHSVQVSSGQWRNLENESEVKGRRTAMARGAVGALPSMMEIPGQIAGAAVGGLVTKTPAGVVGGRAIGGGAGRALGEFGRKGLIALNPELGQPDGGGGTNPLVSFGQGVVNSVAGDVLAGTAGRAGLNLLRRSYRPSPTLVSRFADMPDGSISRDRLILAAEKRNLPPTTEGAEKARDLKLASVKRAKTRRNRMNVLGQKGRTQNIVDRELAYQRGLGVRRPAGWEDDVSSDVLQDLDAIGRSRTRRSFGIVEEVPAAPPSQVVDASGAPAVAGTPPTIRVRGDLTPNELDLLRRGAGDVAAPGYAQNQAGQATRSVGVAEAQRIADFVRDELYGLKGGRGLEQRMSDVQEMIGVARLLRSAGLSPQPTYLRPTGTPVGAPFPPALAFGVGRGMRTPEAQASMQYSPALLDILASYFGNLNPEPMEPR